MKRTVYSKIATVVLLSTICLFSLSCRDSKDSQTETSSAAIPDSLFLAAAPTGVQTVSSLKEKAKEGDEVVIKTVVGGREKVFVNNRAVMTVIDVAVENPCTKEDDHCATPWDYCCTPSEQLIPHLASVQIVGADNQPLTIDLNTVDKLKPMNVVVIQGPEGQ